MKLILYDRSRVTTDWSCPRKRYWQYEHQGRGIVSGNTSLELYLGTALHDGLSAIARGLDIEVVATTAQKEVLQSLLQDTTGDVVEVDFASEQAALVEGLLRGFYMHCWPRILGQGKILFIEEEVTYEHNGLVFMSRPDLVIEREDGQVVYVEYKSTSSKKEGWVNSWATAVQLHSTIEAIKASKGVEVNEVLVQGLYKGFESYGKQSSPFCYGYHRNGNPPFTASETLYEYRAGFRRIPTWEMPGGVKAWVERMPANVLTDQFPQVPPIFVNEDLIRNFFNQRAVREHEIDMALDLLKGNDAASEEILNTAFPQRFDQCHPYFGRSCQFLKLCHGHSDNPLKEGFEYRMPHHELEVKRFEDKGPLYEGH